MNKAAKPRLMIAHPYLHPSGGGNAVAAWALQALRERWRVTLATLGPVDYDAVNRSFGTSLHRDDCEVCIAPARYRALLRLIPTAGALAEICMTMRWGRDLDRARNFDVLFSTQNEFDFGRPGLQYVHYPWAYLPRPDIEMRWFHRLPGLLALYRSSCCRLAQVTGAGLRQNLSLANSEFVAGRIRDCYGMDSRVVYPPVPGDFPQIPWEKRREAFVAVGRVHPVKRWVDAVRILEHVREQGHAVELTLLGHEDDAGYLADLRDMAKARPWFRMLNGLSRAELAREISLHRYGIHAMHEEHFGIAPAEIQRAGCVVFVHNSGGPAEIVGRRPELTFDSIEEASAKIRRVLEDAAMQVSLREHAAVQRERFSAERFCEVLRETVEAFFST